MSLLNTVYRMERPGGIGPFDYSRALGRNEKGWEYSDGFSEALSSWLKTVRYDDPITLLFNDGHPDVGWMPDETHPYHTQDIPNSSGDHYSREARTSEWKIGCKDREQLEHWFPKSSFEFFNRYEFYILVAEVPSRYVRMGQWQLEYHVPHAKVVDRLPLLR